MKKNLLSLLTVLAACCMLLSCSSSDDDTDKIRLRNHTESGCKGNETLSNASQTGKQQSKKMVDFGVVERISIKGNDKGMLNVFHENASFTCEAEFNISAEVSGNTIVINEDAPPSTNCICNYDLTSVVGPLETQTYTLIIKNNNAVICSHQFNYSKTLDESIEIQKNGDASVNVLFIESDKGETSTGLMYQSGEEYNPPHGYLGQEIKYNGGNPLTIYHMSFVANIKGSDIFEDIGIGFESDQPMSFSDLKAGDTFDSSQFQAYAAYTRTWPEKVMKTTKALSGMVTVLGTEEIDDKTYMILRLTDFKFDAIDHSFVYTVNGTVVYEIWGSATS